MSDPILVPFDHTYILYDPRDPLSLVFALCSLYPIGVLVFYFSWFVTTREIEAVIIAGGHVVNDLFNVIAKNFLKHSRPGSIHTKFGSGHGFGYGMPSAHSQFMGFLSFYFILKVWLQWENIRYNRTYKVCGTLALLFSAAVVVMSRLYLEYHSVNQVIVGYLFGGLLGCGYFCVISIARTVGFIRWITSWRFCQLLQVRDSWVEGGLSLKQTRERWEQESNERCEMQERKRI
ncbi:unnamed protein product [Kuraishia capsulata CBS 1993]|uniref:Phosphatidic acid phosphatase type 2/haloperoxidase domain-containing protein n=1 Tax=Kuraishia capsulata CBS 1993 TaxID=1382522 RepID=W6MVB2_9ASCO|nr:uncharacterized protein KUCA_T00002156001 [Kuraishia capsulata CBS 1993]CDK26185.1 unnamed protein product [Kuraishia capsulata CBS 1993]